MFGQIQVGFRQAGTSVDSASGAAPVWGGPRTGWGSPGTGSYAGALCGAALAPPGCGVCPDEPRLRRWKRGEGGTWRSARGKLRI